MAFSVTIGADAQSGTGFKVEISSPGVDSSLLDFTLPSAPTGSVLLIAIVRNGAVECSDATWTQVVDGVGASGIFVDVFVRAVDGTAGSTAGEVISFLSMTSQELTGSVEVVTNADATSLVYDVQHAAFTADSTPDTPSITAAQDFDTLLCLWSATTVVTLTAPSDFTSLDSYTSSSVATRSLLVAERSAIASGTVFPGSATSSAAATGRAFTIAISHIASPPGSTLTAMQAGNVSTKWVAAIEGYANLLTDGDSSAVLVAWDDTEYNATLGGLYVRLSPEQRISPWDPFANTGGSLTLQVVTDQFGVDTHLKSGGNATQAKASIDCDDTTISVNSAASFSSTGTIYVGTEAMTYTGKTSTTFTGLTRGKYSPFLTDASLNFAHPHAITEDDPTSVPIPPVVSSTPRTWIGKWVGLWRHLYDQGNNLLNIKSDALLAFAGRITEVRDNPATMTTDVECQHVLEYIRDAVLGDNPWKATIEDGITVPVGMTWRASDFSAGSLRTADPLVAVSGTPANNYEIEAKRYTLSTLKRAVNLWLDTALDDGGLFGTYSFDLTTAADGTHGRLNYRLSTTGFFTMELPYTFNRAMGSFGAAPTTFVNQDVTRQIGTANHTYHELSVGFALRSVGEAADIENQFGTFFDQSDSAPDGLLALIPSGATGSDGVGICLLNDKRAVIITKSGDSLVSCTEFDPATGQRLPNALDIPWDEPGDVQLRQIFVVRDTFKNILLRFLCSTGTAGFNSLDDDVYPATYGLGIPFDLLTEVEASLDRLNHADQEITVIINRPKKFIDIVGGALKLRFAFLRWKSGKLEFYSWATPTTGDVLEERNKASPEGNQDEQRSTSKLSNDWARNVIKIEFDRDFTVEGESAYKSHRTVINRTAIDDSGGKRQTETISEATSYATNFLGGSGSLDAVISDFVAAVPLFTQAVRTTVRTIAPTMFEGLSVGDCVLVSDNFARDPSTGARGVAARPGIIVAHGYEPGGFTPDSDKPADMHGQVEVMFLDLLNVAPYVPAANLSSYTGSTITCTERDYSTPGESVDATWMSAGRKIRIIERDPADPAAPLSWDRVVSSQSGDDIVLTVALSSPTYDAAKFYRVIWDDYPDALAAQQAYAYQADDADYLIADARAPYQYTINTTLKDPETVFDMSETTGADIELPPTSSYGDGVGLDVGHVQALNRLAANLYDYKTAASMPMLFRTAIQVLGDVTHEYQTVLVYPVFLGSDGLPNSIRRKLYVAPMWKSSTGSSVNCRISLTKQLPTGATPASITLPEPSASVSFTTTSTSLTTSTAQGISYGPLKDLLGVCYVVVELQVPTVAASTVVTLQGIATSYQGPRE